jgi:DMSO/TMAO reductase YedYZ molybdopterin-dependent catalytic subunit
VAGDGISLEELGLAARNHGLQLEALRWDVTPIGLHYLLIHYDIPEVDRAAWALRMDGAVAKPGELRLADLRARPAVTRTVTMECAGNGRALLADRPVSQPWLVNAVGTAAWTGVPLADLLAEAGVGEGAVEVLFTGLDRGVEGGEVQAYQRSLALEEALGGDLLVAYDMNGGPLPPQHGAPARLVVPGWYGMTHVKWLDRITVLTEPFTGFQQRRAYRMRTHPDDEGRPVTRMMPRSLIRPPGIPEFLSRARLVDAGDVDLEGRAWSGHGPIRRVEVSIDGGHTWGDATVEPPPDPYAWQRWRLRWHAVPGSYEVWARATDATGLTQPLEPVWNVGGYEVNPVHRVAVEVR